MSIKEIDNLDKKRTVSIDFDGVIHDYSKGFQGVDNAYDPPKEGVFESLQMLKDKGYILKIMSSRPAPIIVEWLEKYEMSHFFEGVYNDKFPATIYIDDRGFHFQGWEQCMNDLSGRLGWE